MRSLLDDCGVVLLIQPIGSANPPSPTYREGLHHGYLHRLFWNGEVFDEWWGWATTR